MNKLVQVLKSRTIWTLVILFVINGFNGIRESIPATALQVVDLLLGLAAAYLHVNPSQEYKG